MSGQNRTFCEQRIRDLLSEPQLDELARETGFMKRKRKLTAVRAIWSILVAFGAGQVRTLADIHRTFLDLSGDEIEYKPFHQRLAKPGFPEFLRSVLELSMERFVGNVFRHSSRHLRRFEDILAHDGSSFALNNRLRKHFPGRFSANRPAGVELHCTYSLFAGQCTQISVAPDIEAERHFLPDPEDLHGKLLLLDAGYFWHDYFRRVREAGGNVICRGKRPVNPKILGVYSGIRAAEQYIGNKIGDVHLPKNTVDLLVEGKDAKGQSHVIRLVAKYSRKERGHVLLFTTLDAVDMPAETIASLYRLRWQVELFFKECKSYTQLQRFQTADPHIAEGLIWATMLALVFRRFLLHAAFEGTRKAFSTFIAATTCWTYLPRLAEAALQKKPARFSRLLQQVQARLRKRASRTNVKRPDTWQDLGLVPDMAFR